jgi:hypothetical protein
MGLAKRELRIVRWAGSIPLVSVRTFCNRQFTVPVALNQTQAQTVLDIAFNEHKCKGEDASQTAARIVKEATEEK